MVMTLQAPVRQLLQAFADGTAMLPTRIGVGEVYLVPSESTKGDFYMVCQLQNTIDGALIRGWVCTCPGFRFGKKDDARCKHIDLVEEGLIASGGLLKPWRSPPRKGRR